ncbi:hypothetical protein [Catenulispora subtropica]|uniref:COG4280 domain-containing protein n=1 Tax=Catenulispora subtropica TaxID=450798 RepID=UPI0031DD1E44
MGTALLLLSVYLACAVEAVEALTIVLAAGVTRGWRPALQGVAAGLLLLGAVVAALGPALTVLPLKTLRLVVGGLLLTFGLQWLRKAILRASGDKDLRDEAAAYRRQVAAAARVTSSKKPFVDDWYAFTLSFKGVVLEGLEVAFIALTFGANQHGVALAALAAVAAVLTVAAAGVVLKAPLARVPENTMKFAVGVMLTGFGIFWGAAGAGAEWPGGDAALPVIVAYVLAVAATAVWVLRRRRAVWAG